MDNNTLLERDLKTLWHPCTQMKDHEWLPLIPIEMGQGVWLYDFDGKRYLDAISSWWVNLFGHSHPYINQAIANQIQALQHVLLAGFTHEAAVELAEKLVALTPKGLERVFYADNGSSAVEVALKMSYHSWRNQGKKQKTKFVNLSNSYHGETLGALAVGDVALYKETYEPLLMKAITVESPDCFHRAEGQSCEDYSRIQFQKMEQVLSEQADEICAVIVEPLVQCAGSMRMYDPVYLSLLRKACDQYGVHLIADEIAVGFGRTGTLFACEQATITPDFMCLSKGLTGGYLPLSAVLTTDQVYQSFYDDYENLTAFLHSHSYTGNALACRAALATLHVFETENAIEKNRGLAKHLATKLEPIKDMPHVAEVRQTGMIAAIELAKDVASKEPYDWKERRGLRAYQYALDHEVLLRPL
ncbi:MAG: adenosylmethionine--8-amino-7-oxononanoate transaminase, partial [Gammaproteobacteria bacterium]|nr:adenosylmethionine--8-amino-7-oxononanoate transaminase [Gammaproteobacteria bacterium]